MDLIYITGILLFFILVAGLAYGCSKLGGIQ
jgi:hypothetical protein